MSKLGPMMIEIGDGQALVAIVLFDDVFIDIAREGIFDTIQPPGHSAGPDYDRIAFFWLILSESRCSSARSSIRISNRDC